MSYDRVITYGRFADVYRYSGEPRGKRVIGERVTSDNGVSCFLEVGQDVRRQKSSHVVRSEESAKRATVQFRRLVGANLSRVERPVFASLTYRENMESIEQARKDFKAFARRIQGMFGSSVRYISVFEFQSRGAVHFHVLLWGLPDTIVASERDTRLVASIWGKGYVDLVLTDGSPKLATYLSKYMSKMFLDQRLAGKKAYISSQNIKRPVDDKNASVAMYFSGEVNPDLRDYCISFEKEYDTLWLGRAIYKQYQLLE